MACDPLHDLNCAIISYGKIEGQEYFILHNPQIANDRNAKASKKIKDDAALTAAKAQNQEAARALGKSEAEAIIESIKKEYGFTAEALENQFVRQYENQINSHKQAFIKSMEELAIAQRNLIDANETHNNAKSYIDIYFSCFRDSPTTNNPGCDEIRNRKVKERQEQTKKSIEEAQDALNKAEIASKKAQQEFTSLVKNAIEEGEKAEIEVASYGAVDSNFQSQQQDSMIGMALVNSQEETVEFDYEYMI